MKSLGLHFLTYRFLWIALSFFLSFGQMPLHAQESRGRVLVYTHVTHSYTHTSRVNAAQLVQRLGTEYNFTVDWAETDTDFDAIVSGEGLGVYDAIVFAQTAEGDSADILSASAEAAFEAYIRAGGGFVGIHAASDIHDDGDTWDTWFTGLIGAEFAHHPRGRVDAELHAQCDAEGNCHHSVTHMDAYENQDGVIEWKDEMYNFETDPYQVTGLNVVLTVDEDSYSDEHASSGSYHNETFGTDKDKHPISWYQNYTGGRSWYTALGHSKSFFNYNPGAEKYWFQLHVLGGIEWAAGWTDETPNPESYEEWIARFSLAGSDADKTANPSGDGISNLTKYSFNMDPSIAGPEIIETGVGESGLPYFSMIEDPDDGLLMRLEFIRRVGATWLTYTPEQTENLGAWSAFSGTESVTSINDLWERVVIDHTVTVSDPVRGFARVRLIDSD